MVLSLGVNGPRPVVVRSPGDIGQSTRPLSASSSVHVARCGASGSGPGSGPSSAPVAPVDSGAGPSLVRVDSVSRYPSLPAGPALAVAAGAFHRCMAAARLEWWRNASMSGVPAIAPLGRAGVGGDERGVMVGGQAVHRRYSLTGSRYTGRGRAASGSPTVSSSACVSRSVTTKGAKVSGSPG